MGEHVLVSPLGFSPGAVTGLAIALMENNYPISHVITVGTSHDNVHKAARYLENLFHELEDLVYEPRYIKGNELRDEEDAAHEFVAHMGLALEAASQNNNIVHVGVTGGRSGMGALAALATNLYGADFLWHMWVTEEIERGGRVTDLEEPLTLENRYLNPTLEEGAYELVSLPFIDLRPLHPLIWEYHRTGKAPDTDSPLYRLFVGGQAQRLQDVFPAGLTLKLADELIALIQSYPTQSSDEQARSLVHLGAILTQAGITEPSTEDRLRKMMQAGLGGDALQRILDGDKDKVGFWQWVKTHQGELTVSGTFTTIILQGLELFLKARGYLP